MARVSRKEIAPLLGITTQRLGQLIREGKITEHADGIDPAEARAEYDRNTDAAKREAHRRRETFAIVEGDRKAPPAASADATDPPASVVVDPATGQAVFDFNRAKSRKEHFNAERSRLAFEKDSGLLLPRDAVVAREFEIARTLRDRLLGLPARVANYVPSEAMKAITDEVEALIREMQADAASVVDRAAG